MSAEHHWLETSALRKEYPGTVALSDVTLRCEGGKIRALLGSNGAGKSTLVRILGGAVRPTSGRIALDGATVTFRSPREALLRGIATVHQELSLIPGLTVAENIFLGRLPRARPGLIDWRTTYDAADGLLGEIGLRVDVRAVVGRLGVAHQQMVEIAKAMSHRPSVLMLDEPTSALARRESERLFTILKGLAGRGVVLLYITHRLGEIHRIADEVSVLRNGELSGTVPVGEATPAAIVDMMFGGEIVRPPRRPRPAPAAAVMEVSALSRGEDFRDVSFTVRGGEILGIAGLVGSGRTELLRALVGADGHDSGSVTIGPVTVRPTSPMQMKGLGLVLAPEDRRSQGLVQVLGTRININLARFWPPRRITTAAREIAVAAPFVRALGIASPSLAAPVSELSGGNQQKVVLAKWLATGPRVLLLDEPTRGIDLQAKGQLFRTVRDLSAAGISSVIVSSELEELLEVCDRILVMKQGRIAAEPAPPGCSIEELITLCMG